MWELTVEMVVLDPIDLFIGRKKNQNVHVQVPQNNEMHIDFK